MSENTQQNQTKQAKSGADVLKAIEEKVYSGKLGTARKKIEDLVPTRDKAFEAYSAIQEQLDNAVAEFDELVKSRA
jgi:hypothetical protein